MRYYKPRHFDIRELVPPELYNKYKSNVDTLYMLFDPRILWTADALRDKFKCPVIINDWSTGGTHTQRGFRTDADTGAVFSQHRCGRALDMTILDISADDFRKMVRQKQLSFELMYVTRIEDSVSWIHLDVGNVDGTDIVFFTDSKK